MHGGWGFKRWPCRRTGARTIALARAGIFCRLLFLMPSRLAPGASPETRSPISIHLHSPSWLTDLHCLTSNTTSGTPTKASPQLCAFLMILPKTHRPTSAAVSQWLGHLCKFVPLRVIALLVQAAIDQYHPTACYHTSSPPTRPPFHFCTTFLLA